MYENTDARDPSVAAELIEAGVDVNGIFRRLYERVPREAAADRQGARADRRGSTTRARRPPTSRPRTTPRPGADETLTEGIIDFVRGARGHLRRRGHPRQTRRASARPARSACAPPTVPSTSRPSRARWVAAGTRVPPVSRPTELRRADRVPQRRDPRRACSERFSDAGNAAEPAAALPTSRRASPPTTSSPGYRRELRPEDRPRRDARPVRDRVC